MQLVIKYYSHYTIYSLLLVFIFFTYSNGQNKTQPKLVKTQGTNEYENVHCGLQDKEGNMWFGTTGEGVYRYDGKLFTQFTVKDGLSCDKVWSILEDKTGNIWFGTDDGLCRYDGKTFSNVPISVTNGSNLFPIGAASNNPSTNNAVWSMLQDKSGKFWFGTSDGVYCYDGIKFTHFLDNDGVVNNNNLNLKMVQCIIEDKKGNIWFASGLGGNEGICLYDGKTITNFKPSGGNVRKIIEDKNGTIWVAYQNCVIFYYDGKNFYQI